MTDETREAASQARREAERQLAEVRQHWQHVRGMSAQLRRLREENHFAAQIRMAFER